MHHASMLRQNFNLKRDSDNEVGEPSHEDDSPAVPASVNSFAEVNILNLSMTSQLGN